MNSKRKIIQRSSRNILLLVVTALFCFDSGKFRGDVTFAAVQQAGFGDPARALAGTWDLFVFVDGAGNSQPPVKIVWLAAGNKLTGKITVPKIDPTANGLQTIGNLDLTLSDLKLSEKSLSFIVNDDGNEMEAELVKLNENEFEGRWRSVIKGRWKSARSEFAGVIKMKRKK